MINSTSVSRTFLAATLVLVAMGLAAMAGYAAKGVFGENSSVTGITVGHPAPGTVLRQDNPPQAPVELPAALQSEIGAQPAPRLVIDQNYVNQFLATPGPEPRSTGHRNLP